MNKIRLRFFILFFSGTMVTRTSREMIGMISYTYDILKTWSCILYFIPEYVGEIYYLGVTLCPA